MAAQCVGMNSIKVQILQFRKLLPCFLHITFDKPQYSLIQTKFTQNNVFISSYQMQLLLFSFVAAMLVLVHCRISLTLHAQLHHQCVTLLFFQFAKVL